MLAMSGFHENLPIHLVERALKISLSLVLTLPGRQRRLRKPYGAILKSAGLLRRIL
jgi:hypothetical protein